MIDIETLWSASLAMLAALLGFPLARQSSRFRWFGVAAIALLFAMACQTEMQTTREAQKTVSPQFAGIDPVTSKYFEGLWLLMQEQKLANTTITNR